ncbi:hypothetical protein GXW83_17150 [Streptacidiphilus sp. PB12-B1b]|uniref:hypothetical protein n=1 Tax=Streptacidiphilus sp. PB12-B1b TaxID=2705012 RepID=UPI0015F8206A|nr:hypothetical protein [Streptacidiphilus sp. PB12-B1b]QMU77175.1 hypothetical protein GXW83_17150 [Streptacidiphilus sp. PB12-B1b]
MKVFGREPVLWLSLLAIIVKVGSAVVFHASGDQQAVVNAVAAALAGLGMALSTHDGIAAAVLGLVQAMVALGVGFGLHWSPSEQAMVMSTAAAVVGMFTRTQVTAPVPATALPRPAAAGRLT